MPFVALTLDVCSPFVCGARWQQVDIRIRVKGGGHTAQIYAIRQAIAKSIVAYYQKCALTARCPSPPRRGSRADCGLWFLRADVDEASKKEIKDILLAYDRTLLVADPRRCESKKFGGNSARARFQKSYR